MPAHLYRSFDPSAAQVSSFDQCCIETAKFKSNANPDASCYIENRTNEFN